MQAPLLRPRAEGRALAGVPLWARALPALLALLACRAPEEPAPAPAATAERAPSGAPAADSTLAADGPVRAPAPPALEEYLGRRIARTMHWSGADWLLRETREDEEHAAEMIAALGLEPGDTVCDLGCGNGYHSLRLAREVGPGGRVLAVDIQAPMLAMLEERARAAGVGNVETILAEPHDPRLPPASCDLVLMVDVYHEVGHPEQVLAAVRRALRPGGELALVEFRAEDPDVPIRPLHKMSAEQARRELEANGFVLARRYDALPWQHVLFFHAAP